MPTYDYKCDACGHTFELFQSIKADPIKKCPACKKNKAKRLIGAGAGLIFKGSGFYITDYRDKAYTDKSKAESGATTDSKPSETGGGETKTESKPAAAEKSEAKPAAKAEPPKSASKSASKTRSKKKG